MQAESHFVEHLPCEACGSSDANSLYSDGHQYCHVCGTYVAGNGKVITNEEPRMQPVKVEERGIVDAIPDRRISLGIAKKYNVRTDKNQRLYPYYNDSGSLVGYKVRNLLEKDFRYIGEKDHNLFGKQTCRGSGKFITVVEGEEDALAVSEMFEGKWDVVSLKNGAASAKRDIKANLEFLEGYDKVVICFDNDAAGKKAVDDVLPLFSHNKAKIVTLPLKDASDMLKANRVREFTSEWWNAKDFKPTGVKSFGDETMWDSFVSRGTASIIPLPEAYGQLNYMMNGGIAKGEVTVIGALTSIGKSTVVYSLIYDMLLKGNHKVGTVLLEADSGEIVEKMVGLHTNTNLSTIPYGNRDMDGIRKAYEELGSLEKLEIYEHHGSSDLDDLFAKMRWMVVGADCDVIILDPLQAAVPSNENGVIDSFMDKMLKLAKETGVSIIIVSHMRKPASDKPHAVSEYDMKGSGSINQIAFNTILLSRDKLAEDEYERNLTKIQLVKCRRVGRTGDCGYLYYDSETGHMVAGEPPELKAAGDINEF